MSEKVSVLTLGRGLHRALIPDDFTTKLRGGIRSTHADDAAFVTAKGVAAVAGDKYYKTSVGYRVYDGASWADEGGGASTGYTIEHFTANDTLAEGESNKICTNNGAAGSIALTLPTGAANGTHFYFVVMENHELKVLTGGSDKIWHGVGIDYYGTQIEADDIGTSIEIVKAGTNDWVLLSYLTGGNWGDAVAAKVETYGFFCGGTGGSGTEIDYIDTAIQAQNATDRGDLPILAYPATGTSGSTYGTIIRLALQYIDLTLTTGNGGDRGNLSVSRDNSAGVSDITYGFIAGGSSDSNVIDYINNTLTLSDAVDKGDLSLGRSDLSDSGVQDASYGYFSGGTVSAAVKNEIDYITLVTSSSNASDRGDLTAARKKLGGVSGSDYGFMAGGKTGSAEVKDIDYILFATQIGNALDRGELSEDKRGVGGVAGANVAFFGGGEYSTTKKNTIDGLDLATTTGSIVDIGDLTVARTTMGCVGGINPS